MTQEIDYQVSELNASEVDAHDTLIHLFGKVWALPPESREKVYERWQMLHLMTGRELSDFKKQLARVNKSNK